MPGTQYAVRPRFLFLLLMFLLGLLWLLGLVCGEACGRYVTTLACKAIAVVRGSVFASSPGPGRMGARGAWVVRGAAACGVFMEGPREAHGPRGASR